MHAYIDQNGRIYKASSPKTDSDAEYNHTTNLVLECLVENQPAILLTELDRRIQLKQQGLDWK